VDGIPGPRRVESRKVVGVMDHAMIWMIGVSADKKEFASLTRKRGGCWKQIPRMDFSWHPSRPEDDVYLAAAEKSV